MDWLFEALGHLLYWFSSIMPNNSYALALVLYALVFKILFLPFSIKQQSTQVKMAKLTPKIELIKAKYKGRTDQVTRQKMQQEIMELQQNEGASPLSGCLPMLLQLPIILWLYKVIRNPLSYICGMGASEFDTLFYRISNAGFTQAQIDGLAQDQLRIISFIKENNIAYSDLVTRELPNLDMFGLDLGMTPSLTAGWPLILVCLIPVFAAGLQWLTMFLTRKWNSVQQVTPDDSQANASMKMMDIMMPVMTLFITFSFTALMGLYWIWQSLFAILQTYILSRAMPLPKYTEEELKEMRKAQKKAEKEQKKALKGGVKYKSLHYIDEDDYDELPTVKGSTPDKPKTGFGGDIPEIKD
ncbi:MAG: YidC/Oxa1 family membrane protein insertase [Clostridia bacterium]|nr:YidC/Oxa1 family membrane protein insertase [Clostridia bacterium]